MIEIVKEKEKKNKKKSDPYYILKYEYMIGDANGNTSEKVHVSADNPYLERYVRLLNALKPLGGHWGIVFDRNDMSKFVEEKQITEEECKFLERMMFENCAVDSEDYDENDEHAWEFVDGVQGDTEYSFLVFEGVKLTYVDEDGTKHKTKIT